MNPQPEFFSNHRKNSLRQGPDSQGHFGQYGGIFSSETLIPLIHELQQAYAKAKNDPEFQKELTYYLKNYVGRPSPLWFAKRLTEAGKGARIYLKREDLNHTGLLTSNDKKPMCSVCACWEQK